MAIFFVVLGSREQSGWSNITLARRHDILASRLHLWQKAFLLRLDFINANTKPHHCSAHTDMYTWSVQRLRSCILRHWAGLRDHILAGSHTILAIVSQLISSSLPSHVIALFVIV